MDQHARFRPGWISDNNACVRCLVRTLLKTLAFSGLTVPMPLYGPRNATHHVLGQDFLNHAQSLADQAQLNDSPLIIMAGLENVAWTCARLAMAKCCPKTLLSMRNRFCT